MKFLSAFGVLGLLAGQAAGGPITHRIGGFSITEHPDSQKRAAIQDIVWQGIP